jgi:hypothetical protein
MAVTDMTELTDAESFRVRLGCAQCCDLLTGDYMRNRCCYDNFYRHAKLSVFTPLYVPISKLIHFIHPGINVCEIGLYRASCAHKSQRSPLNNSEKSPSVLYLKWVGCSIASLSVDLM